VTILRLEAWWEAAVELAGGGTYRCVQRRGELIDMQLDIVPLRVELQCRGRVDELNLLVTRQ